MRAKEIKRAESEQRRNKKVKSPFVSFFVTAIGVILMLSATFAFVIFKTDSFMVVDDSMVSWSPNRPSNITSMSVIMGQIEEERNDTGADSTDQGASVSTPGVDTQLSLDAEAVRAVLASSPTYSSKAIAMSYAYQIAALDNQLGSNAGIAVMANIFHEGDLGVVEYAFSQNHAHGFSLPSGGTIACSRDDVEYLKNWDTKSEAEDNGVKKGSCGFGCIQWSFERRVSLTDLYLAELGNSDTLTDDMRLLAEAKMLGMELAPNTQYYNTVSSSIGSDDTVERWTEAIVDYYVRPSGCCNKGSKMSGSGTSCQTRIDTAKDLYNLLASTIN